MKKGMITLTVMVITSAICVTALKYSNLKDAYGKAEKEKLEYSTKYYEQKDRLGSFIYEIQHKDSVINQMRKDYIEQWEENQVFSSMLAEVENEKGGHEIIERLWSLQKNKIVWGIKGEYQK